MVGEWIVDVLSFKKIFSLCGLKGHIVEIRGGVTLVDGRTTTECEDRARILGSRIRYYKTSHFYFKFFAFIFISPLTFPLVAWEGPATGWERSPTG